MARASLTKLPQPVFHEPIFGADGSLPDSTGFSTAHGSDTALYKQIGDLATKDVVAIPKSKLLEEEFGWALFHRERSRTHLSELGQMVHPYLTQVHDQAELVRQRAT